MKYDWKKIIEEQQLSGQTIASYCEANSIPVGSFYKNKQRMRNSTSVVSITPVVVESDVINFKIDGRCFEFDESNLKYLNLVMKALNHD